MISPFADPFDALFNLQRALDAQLQSEWLRDATTNRGPFPPINVFQQGDNILRFFADWCCEKGAPSGQLEVNTPLYLSCPSWATG